MTLAVALVFHITFSAVLHFRGMSSRSLAFADSATAQMPASGEASRRLQTLMSHLSTAEVEGPILDEFSASAGGLTRQLTSAALAVRTLPRFDVGVMEAYLDDLRSMKLEVYELLRQHPELLPPITEGMTKGANV